MTRIMSASSRSRCTSHSSQPGTAAISDAACRSRSASCAPRPSRARNVAVRVIGVIEVIGRTLSGAAGRVLEKSAYAQDLPNRQPRARAAMGTRSLISSRKSPPSPQLERVVDRHWIVRWDLRGREPFQQEVLPHPSVNLVIEPHGSWVWGVPTTRDVRLLQGEGWAVGTKFKPGAFTALTGIEASKITDGRVSLKAAFGHDLNHREFDAARGALYAVVAKIEARLAPRADVDDPDAALVTEVIQSMRHVGPNTRVEHLAAMHHVAPRTLQRLFRRYVGVGPKWVLKRLRIHQAAEQLTATSPPPWTELALDLATTTTPTSSATSGSSSDAHPPNTPPERPGHARTRTSVRGEEAMPRCA